MVSFREIILAAQLKLLSGVSRSGLLQPLVINTTGLLQFGFTYYLHLPLKITISIFNISIINISILYPIMVICSLDVLKESSKKKETKIKKKIFEVLKQASYRKKRTGN